MWTGLISVLLYFLSPALSTRSNDYHEAEDHVRALLKRQFDERVSNREILSRFNLNSNLATSSRHLLYTSSAKTSFYPIIQSLQNNKRS